MTRWDRDGDVGSLPLLSIPCLCEVAGLALLGAGMEAVRLRAALQPRGAGTPTSCPGGAAAGPADVVVGSRLPPRPNRRRASSHRLWTGILRRAAPLWPVGRKKEGRKKEGKGAQRQLLILLQWQKVTR